MHYVYKTPVYKPLPVQLSLIYCWGGWGTKEPGVQFDCLYSSEGMEDNLHVVGSDDTYRLAVKCSFLFMTSSITCHVGLTRQLFSLIHSRFSVFLSISTAVFDTNHSGCKF